MAAYVGLVGLRPFLGLPALDRGAGFWELCLLVWTQQFQQCCDDCPWPVRRTASRLLTQMQPGPSRQDLPPWLPPAAAPDL